MSTGVGGLPGGEGGSLKRTLRDRRSYVQHLKIRGRIIKDALTSLFDPLRSRFLKMFEKELLNPLLVATCYRTYLRKTPLQSRAKPHARETESIPPLEIPSQTY